MCYVSVDATINYLGNNIKVKQWQTANKTNFVQNLPKILNCDKENSEIWGTFTILNVWAM